jgi:hypothetical protein
MQKNFRRILVPLNRAKGHDHEEVAIVTNYFTARTNMTRSELMDSYDRVCNHIQMVLIRLDSLALPVDEQAAVSRYVEEGW